MPLKLHEIRLVSTDSMEVFFTQKMTGMDIADGVDLAGLQVTLKAMTRVSKSFPAGGLKRVSFKAHNDISSRPPHMSMTQDDTEHITVFVHSDGDLSVLAIFLGSVKSEKLDADIGNVVESISKDLIQRLKEIRNEGGEDKNSINEKLQVEEVERDIIRRMQPFIGPAIRFA
uniref:Uncharacterized protein n=1 Tax=Rhodosorus marinus TaxID=101924 RepID=A0A6T6PTJ8_9RHOD|mmetsp:Transcript_4666/g.6456  ORF Transcript_4666/g.6456 Transcript_4666/m.6456 type:complete len:172 (+) Transcript_4666:255-770(+)